MLNTKSTHLTPEPLQGDVAILGCCPDCAMRFPALSKMESVVYTYLAMGCDLKEAGKALCISPCTISTYKYRIFEKLQIENKQTGLLMHFARERAIVLKRMVKEGKEDISPEFLAGYVQAMTELQRPDVRLLNGENGIISERNPQPPLPTRRDAQK